MERITLKILDNTNTKIKATSVEGNRYILNYYAEINLLEGWYGVIPTSLVEHARTVLRKYGCEVLVKDKRIPSFFSEEHFNRHLNFFEAKMKAFGIGDSLRPIQVEALRKIFFREVGAVVMPTGSGKLLTMLAAGYMMPGSIIIVNPTTVLVQQVVSNILKLFGDDYFSQNGLVQVYNPDPPDPTDNLELLDRNVCPKFIVTTQASLNNERFINTLFHYSQEIQPGHYNLFSALFVDECHYAPKSQLKFWNRTKAFIKPQYKIGFTATYNRTDRKTLTDLMIAAGPVIYEADVETIRQSCIVPNVTVVMVEGNYCVTTVSEMLNNYKTLVMVETKDAAIGFSRNYQKLSGITSETRPAERDALLQKFRNGATNLVATNVLEAGIDLPELEAIVDIRQSESKVKIYQTLGRTMRGNGEKFFIDFVYKNDSDLRKARTRLDHYKAVGLNVLRFTEGEFCAWIDSKSQTEIQSPM